MNQSIRLTRIHALNWYGYQDSIPVDGHALLAGITGSGKSILMDLIQFVLVGDQRLVHYNRSATGDRSDRCLKGYCLGDTKQEENGITQYMRSGAITFVGLEFTWPHRSRVETWGFRIEFVSAAESEGRVAPFFAPAALNRGDFLDADKRPLEYGAFKAMVESHSDSNGVWGRVYPELSEYLRDMAQPTHLNFDRPVLQRLLPMAMSFTFLRSFDEFCRKFILPSDQINVRDVTDSYRAFLRYEQELKELAEQLSRLQVVKQLFEEHGNLRRDAAAARYLAAELRYKHARQLLDKAERELQELRNTCAEEEARLDRLGAIIPERCAALEAIKNTMRELPGGPLYMHLKIRNQKLAAEIARLREIGRSLESALAYRVRSSREWSNRVRALEFHGESALIEAAESALVALESGGVRDFAKNFKAAAEAAMRVSEQVSGAARPIQQQLKETRRELAQLREDIAALNMGRLPFPTFLLNALNATVSVRGAELPARHLRELCELKDAEERWRPAIEVAFTRKFAVVVSPADYDAAELVYHQLRLEAQRESLINPAKALRLKKNIRAGSLADKIDTTHPVADAIISHLFGDLICVERREQLREHEAAIMPDGFMTRGAFVERARHYDNLPFVGRRGLQQQLALEATTTPDTRGRRAPVATACRGDRRHSGTVAEAV